VESKKRETNRASILFWKLASRKKKFISLTGVLGEVIRRGEAYFGGSKNAIFIKIRTTIGRGT